MLCCYQAIRTLICHAAAHARLDPDRISFTRTRDAVTGRASDSACFSPPDLDELLADLTAEITFPRYLVPHRPHRRYDRVTKRRGRRYKTRTPAKPTPLTAIKFWLFPAPA